ncbi:hypothetical protein CLOM_g13274 [Closterium sp. NIES-68]|nr:hypothetical protein CLOM_g13274 [Closterium sp. NIES-68]
MVVVAAVAALAARRRVAASALWVANTSSRPAPSKALCVVVPITLLPAASAASTISSVFASALHRTFPTGPLLCVTDCCKTTFHGVDGLYEWMYMPIGLRNTSAVFQRIMDGVLAGIENAACYIDDVLVFSGSVEEHMRDVGKVLMVIKEAVLTCLPGKCSFGSRTVQYLGFEVAGGRMAIQKAKVAILDKLAAPKDKSTLRAILGFLNYYRKFVANFSKRAGPLNRLLREDRTWEWGDQEATALKDLLEAVKNGPVLDLPKKEGPFILYTDWSSGGMGAVLSQNGEAGECVVASACRSCNPTEANYSSYEGKGLAAVWAVHHFRVHLQGRPFTLVTDHKPLTWLMTNQTLSGRNARWAMRLQEYEFTIQHRSGSTLQHTDGLARSPPPTEAVACLVVLAREVEKNRFNRSKNAKAMKIQSS